MIHAGLPKKFWDDTILAATHVINLMPTILNWKTPFEKNYIIKVLHMKILESWDVYVMLEMNTTNKINFYQEDQDVSS